jgi:hypothetical protein
MRNSFHRRPASKPPITGADRNGIQGDLSAVLDRARVEKEDPRAERPLVMIRSVRYVGETEGATPAAAMSAKSHALYEYLMASARTQIATTEDHVVPFADAMRYLDTPRSDRIREYLDAISKTYVAYDFTEQDGTRRAAGRIQLLHCEEIVKPTGERDIGYRMHPSVRKVILAATQYAHLEVAAFARFKCKYSARLYPKLAYVAGLDERHPLVYKPEDLADELGWLGKKGKFHWGHFEADCLRPAMDDMFGDDDGSTESKVRRFAAYYELRRAATRGRPVEAVVFYVGKAKKQLSEEQKPEIVSLDRERIRKLFDTMRIDTSERPSEELLAQAAGRFKASISQIAQRWAATISTAKRDSNILIGSLGILTGDQILKTISSDGVGAAFSKWLVDWKEPLGVSYRPGQGPAAESNITSAKNEADLPSLKPLSENGTAFDEASSIRVVFDSEPRSLQWLRTEVLESVQRAHSMGLGEEKTLQFEWTLAPGKTTTFSVKVQITEHTIRAIKMAHRDIIETIEYVA